MKEAVDEQTICKAWNFPCHFHILHSTSSTIYGNNMRNTWLHICAQDSPLGKKIIQLATGYLFLVANVIFWSPKDFTPWFCHMCHLHLYL